MTLERIFQRTDCLFRMSLTREAYTVVDAGVFSGQGAVIVPKRFAEGVASFGRPAEPLQAQREQPVRLGIARFLLQRAMQYRDRRLETVEQVQRAPIVEA